jgi:hypothetical protein
MKKNKGEFQSVQLQGKLTDADLLNVSRMQFIVSLTALIGGMLLIALGILLVYLGFNGSLQWSFSAFGVQSKLVDASPGVFVMVVGIILIAVNRFSVTATRK